MNQVRLVLWKDIRHLGPQVGLYAVLLAAFVWAVPQNWPGSAPNSFITMLVTLLKILLGLSQFVLITSAVHADRLVGQEQFWITRPYDWRAMLIAKLVFVLTCVALPLVLMQSALLHVAGIGPFTVKTAMASSFLRLAIGAWLPLMVIAAVTDNIRTAFTVLAAVLLSWAVTLQFILSGTESRMFPPDEFVFSGSLFAVLLLAILAYQYARRRTTYSCVAIAATSALFLLFIYGVDRQGFGEPIRKFITTRYTQTASRIKLSLADTPVPYDERTQDLAYLRNAIELKIPIHIEGISTNAKIRDPNVLVVVTTNAHRYESPWQNASVSEHALGLPIPKSLFNQLASTPASIHLELLGEELFTSRVTQATAADRFHGPMHGTCFLRDGKVICRIANGTAQPTRVQTQTACNTPPATAILKQAMPIGSPDPVVSLGLPLQQPVCSGQPLTFTEYGNPQRFHASLDIRAAELRNYRVRE